MKNEVGCVIQQEYGKNLGFLQIESTLQVHLSDLTLQTTISSLFWSLKDLLKRSGRRNPQNMSPHGLNQAIGNPKEAISEHLRWQNQKDDLELGATADKQTDRSRRTCRVAQRVKVSERANDQESTGGQTAQETIPSFNWDQEGIYVWYITWH